MSRSALLLLSLSFFGCGEPEPGDSCEPGDGVMDARADRNAACGGDLGGGCGLVCTGPAGCEGPADFRWRYETELTFTTYCGCDGQSGVPAPDIGSLPTERWQWYGSCEEPCAEVELDSRGEGRNRVGFQPVNPLCLDCAGAAEVDGTCVNADGVPIVRDCCWCEGARFDDAGICRTSASAVPLSCCE